MHNIYQPPPFLFSKQTVCSLRLQSLSDSRSKQIDYGKNQRFRQLDCNREIHTYGEEKCERKNDDNDMETLVD